MNINQKLLKLAKMIMKFATVETDKGVLYIDGELVEGAVVSIEDETGEFVAPEDGTYEAEDVIVEVKDGAVVKIEAKETTTEPTDEPVNEEFSRKLRFAEEGYNELMQKIAKAVGENTYVIEAGDGWAIVSIWYEDEGEKIYRYTYSLDAEGNVILGDREEVHPRFVTEEEEKKLDFEEQTPANEQEEDPKDAQIKELETKITELEGLLQDRDAIISELTEKIKELEDKAQAPVEEPVKMSAAVRNAASKENSALKYFS